MVQQEVGEPPDGEWAPDVLGDGYQRLTLSLAPDDEGDVVTTLVRREPRATDPADSADIGLDVLYLHGWSDYFFQTELADFWADLGARFYAIDLRKYGRSLRPGQTPGFVDDLATYDEDLGAALAVMGHQSPALTDQPATDQLAAAAPATATANLSATFTATDRPGTAPSRRLLLLGHSTGGLTMSLWLARNPGRAAGLVLNSPWLEFQTRAAGRRLMKPAVSLHAYLDPRAQLPNVDLGHYTRSISRHFDGEWDYNLDWRPERGFRETPAWLGAILRGQERVAHGLDIDVPILTLLSARSTLQPRWSAEMLRSDSALDVTGIARRAADLGRRVTIERIEGALHDVILSAPGVRAAAYAAMAQWTVAYITSGVAGSVLTRSSG